ncbi:hypothetical protein H072_2700 [Dactylellina haptotyla CBS 200.50]|uniref:DNA polymerase delta subunit 4 n=1 Tax=Dactylellina haptotyla (strain CBS 200.50) TaxID=1284197 RepID=S8AK64_DACHA|nr:hypothetical protein H072_2700 [Dactylellina haptotyla CBS 200.50]
MPVSTRQNAASAAGAAGQQQTKLNFGATKKVTGKQIKPATHDILFKASAPLSKPEIGLEEDANEDEAELKARANDTVNDEDDGNLDTNQAEKPTLDPPSGTVDEKEGEGKEQQNEEEEDEAGVEETDQSLSFQEQIIERPKLDISTLGKERADAAYKITSRQINEYYTTIQNSRIGAPVHQEGLGEFEKILRHFDLSSQYGPCVGVTRFKRWNRADRFGLEPPIEVLAVLLKSELVEVAESAPDSWKPAPSSAKEGVGSVAYVNKLLDTHTE